MKLPRRRFLHLIAGTAALPAVSRLAMAQTYPTRPVRIMVGFVAGGTADIMARLMGQWLSERLGQQFVVENRTGASSNIATEAVVRASPDGHTSTRRCTTSSISTLSATSCRSRASAARPASWWSIHHFPPKPFPNSSPTPRPIPARSIWHRLASVLPATSLASCSR